MRVRKNERQEKYYAIYTRLNGRKYIRDSFKTYKLTENSRWHIKKMY